MLPSIYPPEAVVELMSVSIEPALKKPACFLTMLWLLSMKIVVGKPTILKFLTNWLVGSAPDG